MATKCQLAIHNTDWVSIDTFLHINCTLTVYMHKHTQFYSLYAHFLSSYILYRESTNTTSSSHIVFLPMFLMPTCTAHHSMKSFLKNMHIITEEMNSCTVGKAKRKDLDPVFLFCMPLTVGNYLDNLRIC